MPTPSPVPVQAATPPLMLFFEGILPVKRATLYFPLPLEEARQRLGNATRSPWIIGNSSGVFSNQYRYDVATVGDTIVIDGPLGHKKWTLHTQGLLFVSPYGTALHLISRLSRKHILMAALAFLFFVIVAVSRSGSLLPIVALLFPYGGLVFIAKYEARTISDLCGRAILGMPLP